MNIVLIGAGNVGQQLGSALKRAGHRIIQVYGKGKTRAEQLAKRLGAAQLTDLRAVDPTADLILLAVPDDRIPEVLRRLPSVSKPVVHTAGNVPLSVFGRKFPRAGVFYPLQTISGNRPVSLLRVPLLIEATTPALRRKLGQLARSLSEEVHYISSDQRQWLHLAGVLTNNFTNHLFFLAAELLHKHRLPFRLLHPLLLETVEKAIALSPADAQTGPARRGDLRTMRKHLTLLEQRPDLQRLYRLFSKSIAASSQKQKR
jgi:predicted short-subunit dehydrogenase-like oxidoreductase (DUF2520 family)